MISPSIGQAIDYLVNSGVIGNKPSPSDTTAQTPSTPQTQPQAATPATAKTSGKPEPQPPYGMQAEQEFEKRYKLATGQDLHKQYADVRLKDGTVHKMLAYNIDGKPYLPQIDGVDYPFQSIQRLGQVPSTHNVAAGHYIPGTANDQNPAQVTQGQPIDDANVALLGFPTSVSTGNTPRRVETPQVAGTNAVPPAQGDPTNRTLLQGPGAQVTEPGTYTDGKYTVNDWSQPQQSSSVGPTPTNTAPELGASQPVQTNENDLAASAKSPDTPMPQDPIAAFLSANKPDPRLAESSKLKEQAAGLKSERVTPKISTLGGLGILALAALSGREGANVIGGAVKGIQTATGLRQGDADREVARKQNELLAKAAGIDAQMKESDSIEANNLKAAEFKMTMDQKREQAAATQDFKNRQLEQASAIASQKLSVAELKALSTMSPEAKMAYLSRDTSNSPEYIAAMATLTPDQLNKLAQAKEHEAKAITEDQTRPWKVRYEQARGDEKTQQVLRLEADTKVKNFTADLLAQKVDWFPKEEKAKLDQMAAETQKAYAQVASIKSGGSASGSGGVTPTSLMTMQSHFMTLRDKANAEKSENQKLLANVNARLGVLQSKLFDKNGNPLPYDVNKELFGGGTSAADKKEYQKLMSSKSDLEAKIAGCEDLATSSDNSLKVLTEQARTGAVSGKPTPTQKDIDYVKSHPEAMDKFVKTFGRKP